MKWTATACLLTLLLGPVSPRQTGRVTVRVVDADTGKVLPARLALRTSDGRYPGDRVATTASAWPNREAHGVFVAGEESFETPPGEVRITAAHGLEYRAQTRTVAVPAGGSASVEIPLHRAVDLRKLGWVAGDMHVHMIHGEQQRPTGYADVATTCRANGLGFVSVAQELVGAGKLDLKGYEAECAKVSTDDFTMLVGGERPQDLLGHQTLLGVADPFVVSNEPPYVEGGRQIHAQGGVVIPVHPLRYYPQKQYQGQWPDFPGNNLGRELVFDALCGPSFDGLSVLSDEPGNADAFSLWFALLNRGLFVPAFADSDACFDRPVLGLKTPGFWNTYFYVGPGGAVDRRSLADAVRRGRTFATTGPLLQFRIDGQLSGATLRPDGAGKTLTLDAWLPQHAFTLEPQKIARVELIRNGIVVRTWEPDADEAHLTATVTEREACWYAARVIGADGAWQVGVASPIYFAGQPVPQKRDPLAVTVRGRIYDFVTGRERTGTVEVFRGDQLLKRFAATGRFRVRMPLDARLQVRADGFRTLTRDLLRDVGPIHRFLWRLESKDLARPETFERFEALVKTLDLEFPLGYRLPGSYYTDPADPGEVRLVAGPPRATGGTVAVAAVLVDADRIAPGDTLRIAALFRDEGSPGGNLLIEARGYDPARPSVFDELKKFGQVEKPWSDARDLGDGWRLLVGTITLPRWVQPGPEGAIDLMARVRRDGRDLSAVGLRIPLGPTRRALGVCLSWPTMPISWPDRSYGPGPLRFCSRLGRAGQPRSDYRTLHLALKSRDLPPVQGCADADDAYYTDQFVDQVLGAESHLAEPTPIRPQPAIFWPESIPLLDATR